jgi:hypothetical protein
MFFRSGGWHKNFENCEKKRRKLKQLFERKILKVGRKEESKWIMRN